MTRVDETAARNRCRCVRAHVTVPQRGSRGHGTGDCRNGTSNLHVLVVGLMTPGYFGMSLVVHVHELWPNADDDPAVSVHQQQIPADDGQRVVLLLNAVGVEVKPCYGNGLGP